MPNRRLLSASRRPLASIALLAPLAGCATTHRDKPPAHAPSPVAFLTGHWIHDDEGMVMEEIWFPPHPANGASAGVLRWTAPDGSVRMYELMSLTPGDDGALAFQLRHFGGDMSVWDSESDGPFRGTVDTPEPGRLVIRCTERNGAVATITYERTGDALVSTLAFDEASGRDPIVIGFVKAE
jgi:hypothetical protein